MTRRRFLLAFAAIALLCPRSLASPTRLAGVDLGAKGARAVVVEFDPDAPSDPVKVLYRKATNPTAGLVSNGKLVPASLASAAEDLNQFVGVFTKDFGVKPGQIHLVGSSAFNHPDDRAALAKAVEEKTGIRMEFLTSAAEEARLTIDGLAILAARPRGLLVDVGSGNAKGGAPTPAGLQTFAVQFGSVSLVNRTREVLKDRPGSVRAALEGVRDAELIPAVRAAVANKPALAGASSVSLTGGIAFAVATLIHPEQADQSTVVLTLADFRKLTELVGTDPLRFPNVDPSIVTNPVARKRAEADLALLRSIYTPENLLAGATVVLAIGTELGLEGKPLVFTRDSQFSWIVGYLVPAAVKQANDAAQLTHAAPQPPEPQAVGQSRLIFGPPYPATAFPYPCYGYEAGMLPPRVLYGPSFPPVPCCWR